MTAQAASLSQARELFGRAGEVIDRWRERWQGAAGQGYSEADEALLDMDGLLQELEGVRRRWGELEPPAEFADAHGRVDGALADLTERLHELLSALDERDSERMRVVSQAVELSAQRLTEAEGAFSTG